MAGRGRHATLPAWMTAGGAGAAPAGAPGAAAAPGAAPVGSALPAVPPRGPPAPGSGHYPEASRAPFGAPGGAPRAPLTAPGDGPSPLMRPAAAAAPAQQQQQPAAAAAAPKQGGPPNEGWSEHTAPDGRKYYFNSVTKVSSWTKPEPLMTPEEKARAAAAAAAAKLSQQPAAAAAAAAAAGAAGGPDAAAVAAAWREHTAPDGRKYYHNRMTRESRWTMPDEMKAALTRGPAADGGPAGQQWAAAGGAAPMQQQQQQQQQQEPTPVYATKEEARDAFKELLASAGVGGDDGWDGALRRIINDPRYGALKTVGERKAVFTEYVQARRNEEKEAARRRTAEAKEAFSQMLDECGALRPGDSYRYARALLQDDARWTAVPNETAREELFEVFIRGLRHRTEERERNERREREAAYRALLRSAGLKASSQWRKAAARLEGDPAFTALDPPDRLKIFQDHIASLEEEERDQRDRAREAERRLERKRRDAFRAMLRDHMSEGRIGPKTRWRDYGPTVEGEPAYVELCRNKGGSRPKELFIDVLEEVEEEYEGAKAAFWDAAKAAGWAATQDSSWDEFLERLEEGARQVEAAGGAGLQGVRDSFRRVFFEEAVGGARLKVEEAERRARRAREDFASFLRHARGLYHDTPWEEFEDAFKEEPEFKEVGPAAARELFDEFIEKLKRKEEKRKAGGDEGEDGEPHSGGGGHKHKKRRSSRHEDDHKSGHKGSKRHRRSRSRSGDRSKDPDRGRSREPEEGEARPKTESEEAEEGEV